METGWRVGVAESIDDTAAPVVGASVLFALVRPRGFIQQFLGCGFNVSDTGITAPEHPKQGNQDDALTNHESAKVGRRKAKLPKPAKHQKIGEQNSADENEHEATKKCS